MASNIQWTPQAFNPVKFDPTRGFAAASKTFGDISSTLDKRKAEESLAANREALLDISQQKLDYTLGAEDRVIAEEERQLAKSVEQGLFAEQLAKESGGGRADALFGSMLETTDPRLQELTGLAAGQTGPVRPEGLEALDKFVAENKASVTDPTAYHEQILTGLLESGKYKYEDAQTIAAQKTKQLFPTMSDEMIKASLTALKGAPGSGSGSGRSGGGTMKDATPGRTLAGIQDITRQIAEDRGITDKTPDTNPWLLSGIFGDRRDVGMMDPALSDLNALAGRLQSEGVTDAGAIRATIDEAFDPAFGNKVKDKYDWRDTDKFKELLKYGKNQQTTQSAKINSKTGAAGGTGGNQEYFTNMNKILARGTTQKMSDDELMQAFLGSLGDAEPAVQPAGIPAPAQQNTGILPPAAAPAPVVPANVPAQTGNIMPTPQPVVNTLGVNPEDIPKSEGAQLLSSIMASVGEAPGAIGETVGEGLSFLQAAKDKSYGKQVKTVTDAIQNTGSLQGISGSDIKVALASKDLSPTEKEIIRKLSALRKR